MNPNDIFIAYTLDSLASPQVLHSYTAMTERDRAKQQQLGLPTTGLDSPRQTQQTDQLAPQHPTRYLGWQHKRDLKVLLKYK